MRLLSKSFLLILVLTISGVSILVSMPLGLAQGGTNVSGIISSDTTWTKINSPYSLTGNILVSNGVTLTVEAGATVNLNGYYIQVDGTLQAVGSTSDSIKLIGNSQNLNYGIDFTSFSSHWNEKNRSGCVIETAVVTSIEISVNGTSPKISGNTIDGCVYSHTTGSPIVTNNNFIGGQNYQTAITGGFSSIISNNNITSSHNIAILAYDSSVVSNNIIRGNREKGINAYGSTLSNNVISDCSQWGIRASSGSTSGTLIENNLIMTNYQGIITSGYNNILTNNTIANNTIGIYAYYQATLTYNNIENNSQNQLKLDVTEKYPFNATYNWWGTIDQTTIENSIYDSKNDFNLGTVTFTPFLTAPNSQAIPNQNSPSPTTSPSTSQTPSPTPTVPELSWLVIVPLLIAIFSVVLVLRHRKTTRLPKLTFSSDVVYPPSAWSASIWKNR